MSDERIKGVAIKDAIEERYLAYALSTIMNRALPDVRDGLKPVQRRLLYAMGKLKLSPDQRFKKCARIVGDVIGRFHPHGDVAVYEALVRLAQDFSARYPLVEGQGNFGNIDGDSAAAMRYTESRLTSVAALLLEGIEEEAVDFRPTYDEEDQEPLVLPAGFPHLLANGAQGIAVGMACAIPSHNAAELCAAALHLIRHPKARVKTLMGFVRGPDFPTGGILVDSQESVQNAYETGRGSFRLRAFWEQEKGQRGNWCIVVKEIPWQVRKSALLEKIAEMLEARKIPLLKDVRDESTDEVRLVLEPQSRNVDPVALMETLFRLTDLETRVPLNMNVLTQAQVPRVLDLRSVLQEWLDHRREVLGRRSAFRLRKVKSRLEILAGYLAVYRDIDAVIKIIRKEEEPAPVLMLKFSLSEVQAHAILELRLRALRRIEEKAVQEEHKALTKEKRALLQILKSPAKQWRRVGEEIREVERFLKKNRLHPRRTRFEKPPQVTEEPETLWREPVTVICSLKGWIRGVKGHLSDGSLRFKEGDGARFLVHADTDDKLLLFATDGRFYTLPVERIPGGRGYGTPLRLLVELEEKEKILALFVHDPERQLLLASRKGYGFVVPEARVVTNLRRGRKTLNLKEGDQARVCTPFVGDSVAVLGENRKLLIFASGELPVRSQGRGVLLQRYHKGGLLDAKAFEYGEGLEIRGKTRRLFTDLDSWGGRRASAGRIAPKGFSKTLGEKF